MMTRWWTSQQKSQEHRPYGRQCRTASLALWTFHFNQRKSSSSSLLFSNAPRMVEFDSNGAGRAAGTGPRSFAVDRNQYNLASLEQIVSEWTVKMVAKNANTEGGVKLFCRNQRDILVDTVQVQFPRRKNIQQNNHTSTSGVGMGILLQEIAGGRDDGVGITIVMGLVQGGLAEGCDILPGDVISRVAVVRRNTENNANGNGVSDVEEQFQVITECLGYDATVNAIGSLPPPLVENGTDEMYLVTLKRLRRKPKVRVTLQYPPSQNEPETTLELWSGEILRQAMLVRGVKLNDPLAKRFDNKSSGNCGSNGLCTTCAVSVVQGGELLNPMKDSERQMMAANPRWRLACKTVVGFGMQEGNITVRVNPRQWVDFVDPE